MKELKVFEFLFFYSDNVQRGVARRLSEIVVWDLEDLEFIDFC